MTLSTSLVSAANKLIDKFGNSASLYAFSGATVTYNSEGEAAVSAWGTASTINVIDGGNQGSEILHAVQGVEKIGDDEKIVKASVTVSVNDRLTYDGLNYRIMAVRAERAQSTDIIQIIKVAEVTSISLW